MSMVSMTWHFVSYEGCTIAFLMVDPAVCQVSDVVENPDVFGYYYDGIERRFPGERIRYVVFVRKHAMNFARRYAEMGFSPQGWSWQRVDDANLIRELDAVLRERCEIFATHATEPEWSAIAGPDAIRPSFDTVPNP